MIHGGELHLADGGFWALVASWWVMMAVMMLPVTWPWLRTLHRLGQAAGTGAGGGVGGPSAATSRPLLSSQALLAFVGGYLLVWLGFSLGAAGLQIALAPQGSAPPLVRSGILLTAGLYQLTPAKEACLKRCRSPLSVLLSRWPIQGVALGRMGLEHGLFCLGCCWALMLLGLGAGAVGWLWMLGLVLLVAAEKMAPAGPRVARTAGWVLIAAGALQWGLPA